MTANTLVQAFVAASIGAVLSQAPPREIGLADLTVQRLAATEVPDGPPLSYHRGRAGVREERAQLQRPSSTDG